MLRIRRPRGERPPEPPPDTATIATRKRDPDAEFVALLRRKVTRAAAAGALTAAIQTIPGLGTLLGFVFGELLDAAFLARIQRELIEDVFALYGLKLPAPLQTRLVEKIGTLGTGASVAGDALIRRLLEHGAGRLGSLATRRLLPLANIASSALGNAAATYAIGKRARATAKLKDARITALPDAIRAFSGIDERRVLDWSMVAMKSSLTMIGAALKKKTPKAPPSANKRPPKKTGTPARRRQ